MSDYVDPLQLAHEQKQKTQQEISAMRRDTTRQVTAADLHTFLEKKAAEYKPNPDLGGGGGGKGGGSDYGTPGWSANAARDIGMNAHKSIMQAGANAAFQHAIVPGISGLFGAAKDLLVNDPKRKQVFDTLLRTDPVISQVAMRGPEGVQMLQEAYATMARFGPSLTLDVNAVRAFLREAVVTDGAINYATIGNLAQVERSISGDKGGPR